MEGSVGFDVFVYLPLIRAGDVPAGVGLGRLCGVDMALRRNEVVTGW